jgi:hydrogenase/urease accessory protein HupE
MAGAAAVGLGEQAHAHLVSTDLGPFYDGVAHPLVTPEDLLTILGLAFLAAWGGPRAGRRLLVSLSGGWCIGLVAAFGFVQGEWQVPLATAALVLLLGVLGLLRAAVPEGVLATAAGIIGLMRGAMNGSGVGAVDGQWLSVLGIATSVFALVVLLTGLCVFLEKRGVSIVLRVGASWVAAIGLLMLGWELRTLGPTGP